MITSLLAFWMCQRIFSGSKVWTVELIEKKERKRERETKKQWTKKIASRRTREKKQFFFKKLFKILRKRGLKKVREKKRKKKKWKSHKTSRERSKKKNSKWKGSGSSTKSLIIQHLFVRSFSPFSSFFLFICVDAFCLFCCPVSTLSIKKRENYSSVSKNDHNFCRLCLLLELEK